MTTSHHWGTTKRESEADQIGTGGRAYALMIDLHTDAPRRADAEIGRVLARHGLTRQQGSVYFGSAAVNAVACVMAAQDLSQSLPWFAIVVRDIRMLRIEEQNDLLPAVEQAAPDRR